MKYQQSSKREEKSKFITNQLTNMAHIPIQSYLYLLLGTTLFSCAPQELKTPFELKCENIPVPVGVDTQTPRLSWKLPLLEEDSINRVEIWLSTDSTQLSGRQSGYWNKSIIGAPIRVSYDGQPLDSYTTYYWKIGYQTSSKQKTTFSPISSFTTGCLSPDNWKGKWITDKHDITYRPAPYYRKSFQLDKTIEQALLTIASAGLHELSVNGQRAGNHFLDPMYTHFDKRILSVTHDVTSLLSLGENVIGVQLGNGWYNHQSTAVWFFDKASWRNRPKFTAQLHLRYTDGTTEYLGTDSTWQTTDSPVIFNSIYTAEHYDAQKELAGWDSPGFKHILLKPFFPADMNELTIRYNTPYGWLNINWVRQTNDCIRYTIDIPAGTSATFVPFTMPEPQKSITLQAGKHSLELDFIHQLINQR